MSFLQTESIKRFRKVIYNNFLLLLFLLVSGLIYSQPGNNSRESLEDKIIINDKLLTTDPEKAFKNTTSLLEAAAATRDYRSELTLIDQQCWYYYYKSDIDNLIRSAQVLRKKAIEYKKRRFEANAHTYLLAAYEINQLYDKGIAEFHKAMAILEKEDGEKDDIIIAKTRAYTYLANLYNFRYEHKKALQVLLLVSEELEKLKDPEQKKEEQFRNYSRVAISYLNINADSAEYYIKKSMRLKPDDYSQNDHIIFINYSLLGDIQRQKRNYTEALVYYQKAKALIPDSGSSNIANRAVLFRGLKEIYEILSDTVNANHYRLKSKEAELEIAQNKNKSLHKILEDTPGTDGSKIYIIGSSLLLILALIIFIYRLKRKNKLLQEQERESQEYLDTQSALNSNREQLNKNLVEMVENKDPGFIEEFLKVFPGFSEKLRAANPSVVDTEIEFCAFLKLNMPTKDIARCKNIDPRSVQNRKYRIRKKLNIPNNIDIYLYFSQF